MESLRYPGWLTPITPEHILQLNDDRGLSGLLEQVRSTAEDLTAAVPPHDRGHRDVGPLPTGPRIGAAPQGEDRIPASWSARDWPRDDVGPTKLPAVVAARLSGLALRAWAS